MIHLKGLSKGRLTWSQHLVATLICYGVLLVGPFLTVVPISWMLKFLFVPKEALLVIIILMWAAFIIFVLTAAFSLHTRRLHDLNRSGNDLVYMIIPVLNLVLLYWLYIAQGTEQENKYGKRERLNPIQIFKLRNGK